MIDTHCHVWRIELLHRAWTPPKLIDRTVRVGDVLSAARNVALDGVILVESGTSDQENRWLAGVAARNPRVLGFVTYADPMDPRLGERLDRWRRAAKFRGVRFRLEGVHDGSFPTTHAFVEALRLLKDRSLVAELLIEPRHMGPLAKTLDRVSGVKVVIDHMAKPSLAAANDKRQRAIWQQGMQALATSPSTCCKLSLSLPAGDLSDVSNALRFNDVAFVASYTRYALTQFGASRCCWGSDWPLSSLFASYEAVLGTAQASLEPLSADDRDAVFRATAARIYA